MNGMIIQLLVLAGVAVFLILRLRNVLGTREGFEKPPVPRQTATDAGARPSFDVIEGGPDRDIVDHVDADSPAADALARMKRVEPDFLVDDFIRGARGAYEMILMAFESGRIEDIRPYLSDDVHDAFAQVVADRQAQGISIDASFVGLRETALVTASFDEASSDADLTVRFVGEMTSVVKNANGEIIEGSADEIKTQRDVWTFSRKMGANDPNWQLVATGE